MEDWGIGRVGDRESLWEREGWGIGTRGLGGSLGIGRVEG